MASRLFHFLSSSSARSSQNWTFISDCCSCQFRNVSNKGSCSASTFKRTMKTVVTLDKPKFAKDLLFLPKRNFSSGGPPPISEAKRKLRIKSTLYYLSALGVVVVGGSYAAVPLYRIFCASYSYGGTTSTHAKDKDLSEMSRVKDREITIRFFADRSSSMQWNFKPQQSEIIVTPGETALAFYRAENKTSRPVDGISTYNVIPFEAGQYFNKIQCFCFEEQRLNPGETVELPVFFYIDPEFVVDPKMQNVNLISLSYTFFESKEMPDFNLANWSPHANRVKYKDTPKDTSQTSAATTTTSSPGLSALLSSSSSNTDSSNIGVTVSAASAS